MADRTPFYNYLEEDDEMASYFQGLPAHIQETIKQSTGDIQSFSELKNIAEHLSQGKN